MYYAESASLRNSDPRFGRHAGFTFGRGDRRPHPFPGPHAYQKPLPDFKCQCTAEYNVVVYGRRVGAYCADWIHDGGKYCYLAGGFQARSCPGARKSRRGNFFHSEHPSICNACPPLCKMGCPYGFEKDANGCEICKCKKTALIGRKRESDVFVNIGAEAKMWHVGRHGNIDGAEASSQDKIDVDIGSEINGVTSGNGTAEKGIHIAVPPQGDDVLLDEKAKLITDNANMQEKIQSDVFINIGSEAKMWHVGRHENLDLEKGTEKILDKFGVDIGGRIKGITEGSLKGIHLENNVNATAENPGHPPMPPKESLQIKESRHKNMGDDTN